MATLSDNTPAGVNAIGLPAAGRLLFDAEDLVRSLVDRLAVLELMLTANPELGREQSRAVARLVGEAATEARSLEADWEVAFQLAGPIPDAALLAYGMLVTVSREAMRAANARVDAAYTDECEPTADLPEADRAYQAAMLTHAAHLHAVADMPARTLAGMQFKAGLVDAADLEDYATQAVVVSIARDLSFGDGAQALQAHIETIKAATTAVTPSVTPTSSS